MDSGNHRSSSNGSSESKVPLGGTTMYEAPYIEKLEGNVNYSTWKFVMELHLIHDDLFDYTQKTPESTDILGIKRDQRARAKICLMIKPQCLVHVRQCKTAKEAWEALRVAFEDNGVNNRCRLLSRLVSFKLEHFSSITEYVNNIMTVSQQLRDIGKEIDDELLAALMLQGLPERFQPMRLAIENSNIQLTTDIIKTKLLQMDDSFSASTSGNMNNALSTNKEQRYHHRNFKKKYRPIKCFVCGGPHKAKSCPKQKQNQSKDATLAYAMATSGEIEEWILDSGASFHMTNDMRCLKDYKKFDEKVEIGCANGGKLYGVGSGDVVIDDLRAIREVVFVPGLKTNLLSVSLVIKRGFTVLFNKNGCKLILKKYKCQTRNESDVVVYTGVLENGVYKIKFCSQKYAVAALSNDMELWHRRMGHLGVRNLNLLRNGMVNGVSFPKSTDTIECEPCLKGKQTREPFPRTATTRAKEILGLVHSDVCGPMTESISGYKYFLTFIDDFTRKTFVYFLRHKTEVFEKFVEFVSLAETQTGKKLRILRSDNGKEFVNQRMESFMREHGIQHQLSVEYTPEQNGVAERANRTITEKARSMLQESGLDKALWAEAVNTAVFLKNRSPTIALKKCTPEEAWTGKKPDLSMLRVFGCKAFMHVPHVKRTKWDPKSKELILVGYCVNTKGYRLLDPETHKIHKARDVVFFENQKYHSDHKEDVILEPVSIYLRENSIDDYHVSEHGRDKQINVDQEIEYPPEPEQEKEHVPVIADEEHDEWLSSTEPDEINEDEASNEKRYPVRNRKRKEFPEYVTYNVTGDSEEPLSIKDAFAGPDRELWRTAIEEELIAHNKNQTWMLVKPPKSCNVVDSKWIFKIKEEAGGKKRYKARLAARGFSHRKGVDYLETFSPVVRHSSLRTLLALAVKLNLSIDQMDVKTAFLNGSLEETVYTKQPEGMNIKEGYVCLLQKSIYGLKQSPRAWNKRLHIELEKLNYKRSENEPCVYIKRNNENITIVAVYVDDLLIFWNNEDELRKIKRDLSAKFEMKDLGSAEMMLGIRIRQSKYGIKIDQEGYIDKILRKFNMVDCKPVATPISQGQRLEKPPESHQPDPNIPYQALIGSLLYLAVCTRPDIAHAVNSLSQFNSCYDTQHWMAAKRVLRYLKRTKKYFLNYSSGRYNMEGYADADHAGDWDRKSNSGVVFMLQGGAICWISQKQRTIALSTAEAEYVAISEAVREAIFLRRFIAEICQENPKTIPINSDSQSAIAIANNPVHHQRTKHVDVRYHFVREAVSSGEVCLSYKPSEQMVADVLTKGLARDKHERCMYDMGVRMEDMVKEEC